MPDEANNAPESASDPGELVIKIGPLSIFRSASADQYTPEGGGDSQIEVQHRYTVRVDSAWIDTGGVVAFEVEPPYFAAENGNQLDSLGSIVEFVRDPDSAEPRMSVLLVDPASNNQEASNHLALSIRYQ
ncbi:MAG: hypothetical protein WBG02_06405 [Candidatus Acidiferrum sp.]